MTDHPTLIDPAQPIYVDQAADSRRLARPMIWGLCAVAMVTIAAAAMQNSQPYFADVFSRENDALPDGMTEKEMEQEAIAQLISETDNDIVAAAVEGDDAVSRNALLPISSMPIEAARPFQLPRLNAAQAANAERCLTQAIYYEAATESDAGKSAVAQVIINRMRHPAYPDSICSVIYQGSDRPGCQFSFACDGSLARKPSAILWRRSNEIARAALAGQVDKKVGMATHYHANYVLPYWAPKLTKIEQIGAHIFYRWPGHWGRPKAFADHYVGREAIPAFDTLFRGGAINPALAQAENFSAQPPPRDPTDHRSDNDVGGRIDTTKGWTPNIPDPTKNRAHASRLHDEQSDSGDLLIKSE